MLVLNNQDGIYDKTQKLVFCFGNNKYFSKVTGQTTSQKNVIITTPLP